MGVIAAHKTPLIEEHRLLEVSQAAYAEIWCMLVAAGYDYLVWPDNGRITMDGFVIKREDQRVFLDMQVIKVPRHIRDDGEISVLEDLPFITRRMFVITAPNDAIRGGHAHRKCSQLMLCVKGAVTVMADNGIFLRENFLLQMGGTALLLPPLTWITLVFIADSIVNVLCDRPYEAEDYIHDYTEYLSELRESVRLQMAEAWTEADHWKVVAEMRKTEIDLLHQLLIQQFGLSAGDIQCEIIEISRENLRKRLIG